MSVRTVFEKLGRKKKPTMSESQDFKNELALELEAVRFAESHSVQGIKMKVEGENGYPDRLFVGGANDVQPRVLFYVEFKDFGKTVSTQQRIVHELIRRKYNISVYVVDRWARWLEVWKRETNKVQA